LPALGPDHPDVGRWRTSLGTVLRKMGRRDEARAEYEKALAISLGALGPGHRQVQAVRGYLDQLAVSEPETAADADRVTSETTPAAGPSGQQDRISP
jgi:hypothetical protein